MVGLVAGSTMLPVLVLAPFAGALADLRARKALLVAAQGGMALVGIVAAAMEFRGLLKPVPLLILGLLMGAGLAIVNPTWLALVADLVPEDDLADATSLNAAGFSASRAVGPAVGGLLLAALGPGWTFALSAGSYVGVMAVLTRIRVRDVPRTHIGVVAAVADGVRFARSSPAVRRMLVLAAMVGFTTAFMQTLLPKLNADQLQGDAISYGFLLGLMGVGTLVGAFARKSIESMVRFRLLPVSLIGFAFCGAVVGASTETAITSAAMVTAGLFWIWILSTILTAIHLHTPSELRGRTMSFFSVAFVGFTPLGAIASGAVAEILGESATYFGFSVTSFVVGIVAARWQLEDPLCCV
jgi:MFS family permease